MTLGRLVLAWVPVAAWFMLVALVAIPRLVGALSGTLSVPHAKSLAGWRLVEAAVLTLLASLWFDSLGSGGWWLLFLLIGCLVAGAEWSGSFSRVEVPRKASLAGLVADVARYIVAGAILAWRLR